MSAASLVPDVPERKPADPEEEVRKWDPAQSRLGAGHFQPPTVGPSLSEPVALSVFVSPSGLAGPSGFVGPSGFGPSGFVGPSGDVLFAIAAPSPLVNVGPSATAAVV